ncbi:cobalt transporter CbiM [Blastochloris tepida]|uniref:Cobalt transporter CbiM n=1 Tax=Blastochloris tepida TaxID=2233851 RepID=A0A348G376_9HYPH|nr:cobalt transporter CbiM [Blastochloris tepida]BBF94009.1 cobalt transporter CbiM [Blastochloris tepida]
MAHIPDGVLSLPVIAAGGAGAAIGLALGLRALDEREIPKTAILAAVFFVASLVAVPVGPSSVHVLLGGLMGLVLGVRAFAAVFIGLLLQAVLFGFGGLSTLGVDTLNMALPGVVLALLARPLLLGASPARAGVVAAGVAALAVFGTAGGVSAALALSSSDYVPALKIILITYLPLAAVEAVITGFVVGFLARVKPETLPALRPPEIRP